MSSVHIFVKSEDCERESYEGSCYISHNKNTQSFITELKRFYFTIFFVYCSQ